MRSISRRGFLKYTAGMALALQAQRLLPFLPRAIRPVQASSAAGLLAAVAKGSAQDAPATILRTALDGMGGLSRFVQSGQTVAIKVNATWAFAPMTASSTDPELLRALIKLLRETGAGKIIVMDHCSIEPGTEASLRISGIGQVVTDEGVEGVFPDRYNGPKSAYTEIALPHGKAFSKMSVLKAGVEADVRINLALAKTHNVARLTMCLKHMMGMMENPGSLHAYLSQGIADINSDSAMRPHLYILEALRVRYPLGDYVVCAGPETEASNPAIVKSKYEVVAGVDPVLMDAYACQTYYQIKPKELAYLKLASELGVGGLDVDAAMSDGRMQIFRVGAAPSATATPAPAAAHTEAGTTQGGGTATPQPTATEAPAEQAVSAGLVGSGADCTQLSDPRKFLSGALIPAAVVTAGAGLLATRRMNRKKDDPKAEDEHEPHGE